MTPLQEATFPTVLQGDDLLLFRSGVCAAAVQNVLFQKDRNVFRNFPGFPLLTRFKIVFYIFADLVLMRISLTQFTVVSFSVSS